MMSASANNGSGPCGACKFLRRKCVKGCIFAPYFDPDQGTAHFAAVHKVFGASNASKLLLRIPTHKRLDAVVTLCYEALTRVRDPVHGCVGHIFTLQQQVNIFFLMIINWPNLSIFNTWSLCRVRVLIIFSFLPPFPSKLAQNVRWWKNKLIGSNNIYIYPNAPIYCLV